jgi:hypothetical protein
MPDETPVGEICTCGHVREAHDHYRRGSDCGVCGAERCRRYTYAGAGPTDRSAESGPSDPPQAVNV